MSIDDGNNLIASTVDGEKLLERKFLATDAITALAHPLTYLNKVLIGTEKGDSSSSKQHYYVQT